MNWRRIMSIGMRTGVVLGGLLLASACTLTIGQDYSPPPPSTYAPPQYGGAGPTQWPVRLDTPSGLIAIYQPQPESLVNDRLTARAAVSLTPPGAQDPVFGAMWMNARVFTDRDSRTVTIQDAQIQRVRFPDSSDAQQQQFQQIIEQQIPRMNVTFSLDELSTSLDVAQKEQVAADQLQTTPPKIIYTNVPSTLVVIDGQPQLQQVQQTRVMRVVNTPFVILFDMDGKRYFLKAGDLWFTGADATGPWSQAAGVPLTISDAAAKLTPAVSQPNPPAQSAVPQPLPRQVIVATEPTELISTDGEPKFTPLPGNDLLYVSNTQSDLFMEVATQEYFVLLSGRWYHARSLAGPWQYISSDQLPRPFAAIPQSSPKGHVLASVAGTMEAKDAVLDASIPQTAVVRRDVPPDFTVNYDGPPQFQSVQEMPVQYAVNSPEPVLLVDQRYYLCHQAVWYESGVATGPWSVCVAVPKVIYTLPPSCPVYNVRYCYVYGYTPDVVYCGYLPGYTGCYVFGSTVVYGTGYYYPYWYRTAYYPRPWTFGCGARYDIVVSAWGCGAGYGWDDRWIVRDRFEHNWWGPRGYVGYRDLPRLHDSRPIEARNVQVQKTVVNLNIYNRTENVKRVVNVNRKFESVRNENIKNDNRTNIREANRGGYSPPTGRTPSTYENNVYAGHDGQVYRRTNDGWEQRSRQGWTKVNGVPEASAGQRGNESRTESPTRGRSPQIIVPPADRGEATRGGQAGRDNQVESSRGAAQRGSETPQRDTGRRTEQPSRVALSPPGLEADHVARQRGQDRVRSDTPARGDTGRDSGPRGESGSRGGNAGGNGSSGSGGRQDGSGRGR